MQAARCSFPGVPRLSSYGGWPRGRGGGCPEGSGGGGYRRRSEGYCRSSLLRMRGHITWRSCAPDSVGEKRTCSFFWRAHRAHCPQMLQNFGVLDTPRIILEDRGFTPRLRFHSGYDRESTRGPTPSLKLLGPSFLQVRRGWYNWSDPHIDQEGLKAELGRAKGHARLAECGRVRERVLRPP